MKLSQRKLNKKLENLKEQQAETLQKFESKSNSEVEKKLDILFGLISKTYPSRKKLLLRSFLSGIATALGATVGLSLALALLTFLLNLLSNIPVFGEWFSSLGLEKFLITK